MEKEKIIIESEAAYAVFDIFPVSKGHMLIIPREHIRDYFEAGQQEKQDRRARGAGGQAREWGQESVHAGSPAGFSGEERIRRRGVNRPGVLTLRSPALSFPVSTAPTRT